MPLILLFTKRMPVAGADAISFDYNLARQQNTMTL